MAFSAQQSIPHPPAAVAAALASEDFHRSVVESFGGSLVSFSVEGSPDRSPLIQRLRGVGWDRQLVRDGDRHDVGQQKSRPTAALVQLGGQRIVSSTRA